MKVTYDRTVGPEYMLDSMRIVRGKDPKHELPSLETFYKMCIARHSSIRSVKYRIYIEDIPYYNHVHLVRHHVGVEPHVYSQRDDKGIYEHTDRDLKPQGELINMYLDVSIESMINIAMKRLCYRSHRSTQEFVEKLKCAFIFDGDDFDKILGKLLVRPCSWYPGLCAELKPCGRVPGVRSLNELHKNILEKE